MELKPEDFQYLKYNVFPLPKSANILEEFPELARFSEFTVTTELDINNVLRYIIYAYDKRSPFLLEKNLLRRKMDACKLAGFEFEGDKPKLGRPFETPPPKKYPDNVEQMIKGNNVVINKMICRFARNQKSAQYALMVAGMESFYDNLIQLSTPSTSDDKMKDIVDKARLFEHTQKMISYLEASADEIFNGDVALIYEADEVEQQENGKIKSFPEMIATLREEGELEKTFKKIK